MIVVYNRAKTNFHELANAISIQFAEYANDIGKFTLVMPLDDYNYSIMEDEGILYDTQRDISFVIKTIRADVAKNQLTVNGFTCNWLLEKRIIPQATELRLVEQDSYALINANLRGLSVQTAEPIGLSETCEATLQGGQLLSELMPILEQAQLCQRMDWNPATRTHTFRIYKGRDMTEGVHAVGFSEEHGTASDLVLTDDTSVFQNVIYVVGSLQDETEITEIVGDAAGDDRAEFWCLASDAQQSGESEADYRARLHQLGLEEQTARIAHLTFSVTADPSEYGSVYKLGDLVVCASDRFGVELNTRIAGVKYTMDANGEKVQLILGEPEITALWEVKSRNGKH